MKTYPPDSVFVTGVARVSKEDAINAMYGTFTLSLVVDVKTGTIINCSANMIMSDTIDFLRQIIEGKNLVTDTDLITDLLKSASCRIPKSRCGSLEGRAESLPYGLSQELTLPAAHGGGAG